MLQLFDKNKNKIFGLIEYKDLCIESVLEDGDKTLSFLYSKNSKYYFDIEEEGYIRTKQDEFVIKEKDIQDNYTTFICKLNIEELEGKTFDRYESIEQTITVALNLAIVGTGWTVAENSLKKKRTVRKTNCSSWDIIKEIKSTYRVDIIFNTLEKKIEIYEHLGKDKGTYFIEDLNLKSLQVQSNSYSYVTRIIPVGKDGLTIESINNNKNYVENYQYSNKVKTIYWNDDRYTIKESLLEDAKAKLNELSKPYRAYTASIINLSKLNPKYNILDYKLGDDITLISKRNKIKEKQRIIKTIEYPQDHNKDTIELANATLKFEDMQSQFQDAADTVDNVTLDDGTLDGEAFKDGGISSNKIDNFKANVIEAAEIDVIKGDIQDLNVEILKAGQAILTKATITQLNALESKLQHAIIGKADINELNVAVERVGILEGKTLSVESQLAGNLTAENFQANAITAGSGIIADGAIGSAQISDLDVNKLNAGTLDTSKIQILGPNGRFRIIGNKLQVLDDKNGKLYERIMLGVDDNNKSTLALRGKDGQTTLIDENGLTDAGFTNGYGKVKDNSLDASKFDKNSIVRQLNGSTETIKGTKVQIGDRTLDVELSTQKNTITDHGKELSNQKAIIQALDDSIKLKVDNQTFEESTNSINTNINNAKNEAISKVTKDIDNKINNIQIGGRNLLRDTSKSFVSGVMYEWNWLYYQYNLSELDLSIGDIVTFRIYVKFGDVACGGAARITFYDSNNNNIQSDSDNIFIKANSEGYTQVTVKIPQNAIKILCGLQREVAGIGKPPVNLQYKEAKLEKGNKYTDYSPAPEDLQKYSDDVAKVKADLAQANAIANADGKISEEEKKRIAEAKKNLDTAIAKANAAENNAKAHADQVAEQKKQDAIKNANAYTTAQITTTNSNLSKATSEINILKGQISTKVGQADVENSIIKAKITNYGYAYKKDIIIFGDYNLYYPVVIKGGNQDVKRKIFINRSYSEQAPLEWNSSLATHHGGLSLLISTNFGGWGGANYSWSIYDLEEQYSRMFAGAVNCASNMAFAIFLRGGGKNGAIYHLYSDQPLDNSIGWEKEDIPKPPSPQIAYKGEMISFYKPAYEFYAPKPRTITPEVEEEIKKRKFIQLTQDNATKITIANNKISDVSTRLTQTKDSLQASVNSLNSTTQTITTNLTNTNNDLSNKINTAKTDAINSSKSYADIKKNEAISSANSYTNTAKQQAIDSANTHANSIAEQKKNEAITGARSIPDTRSDNQNPSWYMRNYSHQTITEFKFAKAVGIPNSINTYNYGTLETKVPWGDSSGGYPTQIFRSNLYPTYQRYGISNTAWSSWEQIEDTQGSQAKANNALNNAKTYTNTQINTVNSRVSNAESSINILKNQISTKVSQTDIDKTVNNIQIGGRNLLTKQNLKDVFKLVGNPTFDCNHEDCKNGFYLVGDKSQKSAIRMPNIIKSNGEYTISFEFRGSQNTPVGFQIDMCDLGNKWFSTTNDNTWKRVAYTVNVTNYTKETYNFIDFSSISWAYIFVRNIKIERGNKATDWTPAPEDIGQELKDNITTVTTKISNVESNFIQKTNSITQKVNQVESTSNSLNGKITSNTNRIANAESKLTPTSIINSVNSSIGSGEVIRGTSTILDKNKFTVKDTDNSRVELEKGCITAFNSSNKRTYYMNENEIGICAKDNSDSLGMLSSVYKNTLNDFVSKLTPGGSIKGVGLFAGDYAQFLTFGHDNLWGNDSRYDEYLTFNKKGYAHFGVGVDFANNEIQNIPKINFKQSHSTLINALAITRGQVNVNTEDGDLWLNYAKGPDTYNKGIKNVNVRIGAGWNSSHHGSLICQDLWVHGNKHNIVNTKELGFVGLHAYEMAEPQFGDNGGGVINKEGYCYIYLDPIFVKTVNTNIEYRVHIDIISDDLNAKVQCCDKQPNYFKVVGTPGVKFDWEVKCKRKGYENNRLDRINECVKMENGANNNNLGNLSDFSKTNLMATEEILTQTIDRSYVNKNQVTEDLINTIVGTNRNNYLIERMI